MTTPQKPIQQIAREAAEAHPEIARLLTIDGRGAEYKRGILYSIITSAIKEALQGAGEDANELKRQIRVFVKAIQNIPKSYDLESGEAIRAMGRDAERYKFLRDGGCEMPDPKRAPCIQGIEVVRFRTNEYSEPDYEKLEGEELDKAIDAARPLTPNQNT